MGLEEYMKLFSFLGGAWVLYLLLGAFCVAAAIFIERLYRFKSYAFNPEALLVELEKDLERGDYKTAAATARASGSPPALAAARGIEAAGAGARAARRVIARTEAAMEEDLERGIVFIGTLGNNAPFIGLFGTVLGIIRAFHDLSLQIGKVGTSSSAAVMAGISEALVATAVGLFVAIPSVIFYNILRRRIQIIRQRTDGLVNGVLSCLP